jgi:hypothetical protein
MRKFFVFLLIIIAATGCSRIEFRNVKSDLVILAKFNDATKEISVTLPEGDVLKGMIYHSPNAEFSLASDVSKGEDSFSLPEGDQKAYAFLTSESSFLMMELIVTDIDSIWTIPGFGEARTTDGRTYKVRFLPIL